MVRFLSIAGGFSLFQLDLDMVFLFVYVDYMQGM
jgi:hypothetical protein